MGGGSHLPSMARFPLDWSTQLNSFRFGDQGVQ